MSLATLKYDLDAVELSRTTIRAEHDKAARGVSDALAKREDLKEKRADVGVNMTDASYAMDLDRDLVEAEMDLTAAELVRERLQRLLDDVTRQRDAASRALKIEQERAAQPIARAAVAEDLKLFASWVQKHRETLDALKNAGLPDAGTGFTEPYAEILKRFAVRPDLGSMR